MKKLNLWAVLGWLAMAWSAQATLTDQMVAYWDFEGSASNHPLGSGGTAYQGTLFGNATTTSAIRRAGTGALSLDGAGDYMRVPTMVDPNQSWAISVWFQTNVVPTTARQFVFESGPNYSMSYGIRDGTSGNTNFQAFADGSPTGGTGDLSADYQVPDASTANQWHHIVLTYNSSTKIISGFLNGTQRYTMNLGTNTLSPVSQLFIGTFRSANDRYFNGVIDEVAVWNRALSLADAQDAYQRGLAGEPLSKYRVTLTANPAASGAVSGSGFYASGGQATITATPNPGYVFTGWSGALSGQPASISYTIGTADLVSEALFDPDTADSDQDGLTNFQEVVTYGTNPNVADTDGDLIPDGAEVLQTGTNPNQSDADLVNFVTQNLSSGAAGMVAFKPVQIVRDEQTSEVTLMIGFEGKAGSNVWSPIPLAGAGVEVAPGGNGWRVTIPAPSSSVNQYILRGSRP